jgi:DNA-binding HxlR family transcriptional regulator
MDTIELIDPPNVFLRGCASRTVLEVIANKWTNLAVCALRDGPMRFGQLSRHLEGITQKMLTQTLRSLERDGLVTRTLYPTIPPRVDYELTDLGRSVAGLFDGLIDWAQQHTVEITAARHRYDERADRDRVAVPLGMPAPPEAAALNGRSR